MVQIFNEGPAIQPSTQTAIRNGAANYGVSGVVAKHVEQDGDDHVFNIFDEDGVYLFSIDTADNNPFDGQI
jgi:hypothetical protein